jgi:uncharacterized protein (TIGR03437 family)
VRPLLALCSLSATIAWCQKPVIFPSGVVNAASYQAASSQEWAGLPAGPSLISIFGQNLAGCTQAATTTPLPTEICGTSVMVRGESAPLLYVSPGQINLEGGYFTPVNGANQWDLVVTTANGSSDAYQFNPFSEPSFGIFTQDSSGCGQGAVLNNAADGSLSVNSPANSASPGDYLSVFGTGLFVPNYAPGYPPPGSPAPFSPLAATQCSGALLDFVSGGIGPGCWSGLTPGLVGVDQINIQLSDTAREGCTVPLQIFPSSITTVSQPVTISIHQGGGQCSDPPSTGYGEITWEKAITTAASGSTSESDTLTVSLQASPGRQAPPTATDSDTFEYVYFGPSCPIPGYRSLDAGTIQSQGPGLLPTQASVMPMPSNWVMPIDGGPSYIQQSQASGLTVYQASLPAGTIQPGSFTVNATGGADVGAFQSSVQIGSGIQINTPIAGQTFPNNQPLTIDWTGGDPNSQVTFRLVQHFGDSDYNFVIRAHASDGNVSVPMMEQCTNDICQQNLVFEAQEITLEVTPDPSQISSFSASGLLLGGQHTWKYTYRFEGVSFN